MARRLFISEVVLVQMFAKYGGQLRMRDICRRFGVDNQVASRYLNRLGAVRVSQGLYRFGREELQALFVDLWGQFSNDSGSDVLVDPDLEMLWTESRVGGGKKQC